MYRDKYSSVIKFWINTKKWGKWRERKNNNVNLIWKWIFKITTYQKYLMYLIAGDYLYIH